MKESFQELLFSIPIHELTFLTPLPKEQVYYKTIVFSIPEQWFVEPTLLMINNNEEFESLNSFETATRLIQDPNLTAIVLCIQSDILINDGILPLFQECQMPLIRVNNPSLLNMFFQKDKPFTSYEQVSMELYGFINKGFIEVASQFAFGLGTPFLYLDENNHLLWQMGDENKLREAHRWVNAHQRDLESGETIILSSDSVNEQNNLSFDIYCINIAGKIRQKLIASASLADWQKRMIHKLAGLTALLLQTEGMFQEQQHQFQEHFVYDLLYHKFESQKAMIKQAKTWGWNLEKPHHLLLIDINLSKELTDVNWLDDILNHLENQNSDSNRPLIIFPFEDQIIALLEDEEDISVSARKEYVMKTAIELEEGLSSNWQDYQFHIGIGKLYQESTFLNKSYQEAKLALKFGEIWLEGKNIFHISDLGTLRLFLHVHEEILSDYCQEYLSSLIESDRKNGTEYIKTLKAYIQHHELINEVSNALFIHPNTLRNRMKKIEEITGIDLQNTQEFINLIVAIKILSLLSK